jgi:peptidoglycan hydrolase-like protein with peptidoglycan-binding domain
MKKSALFIFLVLVGAANLLADDQIASVQQQLKDQGFYYGQVDGQPGAETNAAIRRYQIRNGLQVSGTLTQETLDSLKGAGNAAGPATTDTTNHSKLPPVPAPLDTQAQDSQQPPQASPPEQNIKQSDREFLNKQNGVAATPPSPSPPPAQAPAPAPRENPSVVPPPVVVSQQPQQPSSLAIQYASLFARTPYENAPFEVQQGTLKNAQAQLARGTYYNGEIDGVPGPATARAIAAFQNEQGFTQTGRLDLDTLSALRLLPDSGPARRRVIIQPFYPPPRYVQPRVYRGIWVN